jgi:pimeloyl-ACP methyl ester carboxylesterase
MRNDTDESMSAGQFPVRHTTLHGNDVAYRRAGEGPVLLLLHGIAGSSETWLPAMRLLRRDFTVVAPDFLGHGASAKPPGDYSLGNYAAGLRDFLDVLEIDRATVIGQSYGGGVAMQFAYQFPERCERLALVDAGGLGCEVSWLLRLVTLPGAEYVLPALFLARCAIGGTRSSPSSRTAAFAVTAPPRCGALSGHSRIRPTGERSSEPCAP